MARIFITGSADGLGALAAARLADQGHQVVLHARNAARGEQALRGVANAEQVLVGDLSDVDETKRLAERVNAIGPFDAIIHNAGVYQVPGNVIFSVNTLAPYLLTALVHMPKRLIYLSSGMHLQGHPNLNFDKRSISYSDSKLYVVMLSMAVARKWPAVYSNAVNPGWVPTKMGGRGAPDDLEKGFETQAWLAVSEDEKAKVTGRYFHHQREARHHPQAGDVDLQERLLAACEKVTGVRFPVS
jgi:NAD(P)-dependent dehydrogenase (short-subunit alcohol dehydrogenase family)